MLPKAQARVTARASPKAKGGARGSSLSPAPTCKGYSASPLPKGNARRSPSPSQRLNERSASRSPSLASKGRSSPPTMKQTVFNIKITVVDVSGRKVAELRTEAAYTVFRLKPQIERLAHVPKSKQQLRYSGKLLREEDMLQNIAAPGSALVVTLIDQRSTDESIKTQREEIDKSQNPCASMAQESAAAFLNMPEKISLTCADGSEIKVNTESSDTALEIQKKAAATLGLRGKHVQLVASEKVVDIRTNVVDLLGADVFAFVQEGPCPQELGLLRDEIDAELSELEPMLAIAAEAVRNIRHHKLDELRQSARPPYGVQMAIEATLWILRPDLEGMFARGPVSENWSLCQKLLKENNILNSALSHDVLQTKVHICEKIQASYLAHTDWDLTAISKASKLAGAMASWVEAHIKFASALIQLEPKMRELKELDTHAKLNVEQIKHEGE